MVTSVVEKTVEVVHPDGAGTLTAAVVDAETGGAPVEAGEEA